MQSVIAPLYLIILLPICIYAFVRGGRDEISGAAIMLASSFAGVVSWKLVGLAWVGVEWPIFIIDMIALLALIHLALTSSRFWPMWVAGFHLVTISIHVATMVAPQITPWAFATGAGFWAWPMMFTIAIGTWEQTQLKRRKILGSE